MPARAAVVVALGGAEGYPGEDVMRTMETIENAATACARRSRTTPGSPTRHAHAEMDSARFRFRVDDIRSRLVATGVCEEPREETLPFDPGVSGHRTSDQSDASDGPTPDATTPDSRSRASRDAIVAERGRSRVRRRHPARKIPPGLPDAPQAAARARARWRGPRKQIANTLEVCSELCTQ